MTKPSSMDVDGTDSSIERPIVRFDSLPYIDYQDADYEAYALSLIEHEMNSSMSEPPKPTAAKSREGLLTALKSDDALLANAPLLRSRYMELANLKRAGKEVPPHKSRISVPIVEPSSCDDREAWSVALAAAKAQLEGQRSRLLNLEVQQSLDAEHWKSYNQGLDGNLGVLRDDLKEQRMVVDRINARRKDAQEAAVPKLQNLTRKYDALIDKRHRIASATRALEREVKRLRTTKSD